MKHSTIRDSSCFAPFSKVCLLFLFSAFFFLSSCKHQDPVTPVSNPKFVPPNNCKTQLLAVRDSLQANAIDYNQLLTINFINRANSNASATFGQGKVTLDNYDHQGLIIGDVYYFLIRSDSAPGSNLQCVNLSTELSQKIYIPGLYLNYLVYDSSSQTFFAISRYKSPAFDSLASFKLNGASIANYKNISAIPNNIISITIDPSTSKIYLLGNTSTQLFVYNNLSLQNIPLSDNSNAILGLRYNTNDNFLYALQGTNIVKINPSTGAITKLLSEPYDLSTNIFGAVFDQCNNQYIISGVKKSSADTGVFIVYDNMLNQLASTTTPWYCYMALSVR